MLSTITAYAKYLPIILLLALTMFLGFGKTYIDTHAEDNMVMAFTAKHRQLLMIAYIVLSAVYYKYFLTKKEAMYSYDVMNLPSYDEATSISMSSDSK
jgi:hypothetical protein